MFLFNITIFGPWSGDIRKKGSPNVILKASYSFKVLKGDTILSPANEIHGCYFTEFTSLIVSSGFPSDQETYEADTRRVSFLSDSNIKEFLDKYA